MTLMSFQPDQFLGALFSDSYYQPKNVLATPNGVEGPPDSVYGVLLLEMFVTRKGVLLLEIAS